MGKFAVDVSAWADKAGKEFEDLRRAIIIELFSSVILDTPVDTGRLRGNWQVSSGAAKDGELEILDPSGSVTIAKVEQLASSGKIGIDQSVFLTNNLPYVYGIEYEGKSKVKAPQGMVRKNFIRITQNLKRDLRS